MLAVSKSMATARAARVSAGDGIAISRRRGCGRDRITSYNVCYTKLLRETASMSRATPCAIGVAWLGADGVTHRAYRLIRPDCPERAWCFGYIHGLYPEDVAAAASFPELWDELAPHLEGALVLAHNAAFDLGVLRQTLDYYGLSYNFV